jgi:hypothetical protein
LFCTRDGSFGQHHLIGLHKCSPGTDPAGLQLSFGRFGLSFSLSVKDRLEITAYLRVSLFVSFLISGVFLPVALHFYPVAATFIGSSVMVEFYWLMPLWKKKWNRDLKFSKCFIDIFTSKR